MENQNIFYQLNHLDRQMWSYWSKRKVYLMCLVTFIVFTSCEKLIEIDPPIQNVIGQEIYKTNSGAASVLTGLYSDMAGYSFVHGLQGISLAAGLSVDEFDLYAGNLNQDFEFLYRNEANSQLGNSFWRALYEYIYRVNSAIEGISTSTGISANVKNQLLGEARFLRAFYYFYLVNLYEDVPLITGTEIKVNSIASRTGRALVYQNIISDLQDAQQLLSDKYVAADAQSETMERVRPNKVAATALLARVYLYMEQWDKAEEQASLVIGNTNYILVPLSEVFLSNSGETIFALHARQTLANNLDGRMFNFLPTDAGPNDNRPVNLSTHLYNAFEAGDSRKQEWTKTLVTTNASYPYANKYKTDLNSSTVVTEYPMVLRLAEQYLIRAETRARQGKLVGANSAEEDLNAIRNRAGLGPTEATAQEAMLDAILQERRVELFAEWGHRWFDLKRTGKIDEVMSVVAPEKGGSWQPFKALYPIPPVEIQRNPSLRGHQNPGYPEG